MRFRQCILLITLILVFFLTTNLSAAFAANERITLEQAKDLARNNCRSLQDYKLQVEKMKLRYYKAQESYNDINYDYINQTSALNNMYENYISLQEQLANGDTSVISTIHQIENRLTSYSGSIEQKLEQLDSQEDNKQEAYDNYEDAEKAEENYERLLDYTIEDLFTSILIKEQELVLLKKESELNDLLYKVENKKLMLGKSTQEEVNQVLTQSRNIDHEITEANYALKTLKGNLNDMLGRDYDADLELTPFNTDILNFSTPKASTLFAGLRDEYDKIEVLKRDIEQAEEDLDEMDDNDESDDYDYDILNLEIAAMKLQLRDAEVELGEKINETLNKLKQEQQNYQLAEDNYTSEANLYEWNQKRYDIGLISKLELMQSELDYLNAAIKKMSAEYSLYLVKRSLQLMKQGIIV